MTSLMSRPTTALPDLFRALEHGWPFSAFGDHHPVRIEDYRENGSYVVRAELPGMDPVKDIQVTVEGNELTIAAERTAERHDQAHTEFSYGSFTRTVRLPGEVDPKSITARYNAGILVVTAPVKASPADTKIDVEVTS